MSTENLAQLPQARLLIDGVWKSSSDPSNIFLVRHPQTLKTVCTAVSASADDVQEAISAAHRAFPLWESTPPSVRRQIFLKAADILETPEYKARLKEWVCKETGAGEEWGTFNGFVCNRAFREAATLASNFRGQVVNSETPGVTFMVKRRPIGVVNTHRSIECLFI